MEGKHGGGGPLGFAEPTVMMTRHHRLMGEHGRERGDGVTQFEGGGRERGEQLLGRSFKVERAKRADQADQTWAG